jgi:Ca2+-binding EF-hand superfamily protein
MNCKSKCSRKTEDQQKHLAAFQDRMFKDADVNNDGKISQKEFNETAKKRFAKIDKNNDKSLTQDEFQEFYKEMKEAHQEAKKEGKKNKK